MIRKFKNWLAGFREKKAKKGFKDSIVAMTKVNKHLIDEKARVNREIVEKQEKVVGYEGQIVSNQGLVDAMSAAINAANGIVEKENV